MICLSDMITLRNAWAALLCAFLFTLCGLLGATLFLAEMKAESDWVYIVPALPFGIACAFLCLRPLLQAITAVPFYCLVWAAAFFVAIRLCSNDVNPYLAMLPAGLVGGVGVAGLTGIGVPRLRTLSSLAIAGAIGAVFALPFALYVKPPEPPLDKAVVRLSFALWQAAVGTYVYWLGAPKGVTSSAA
jgi:hypothetical protein